jgi:putative two-component system response regulator
VALHENWNGSGYPDGLKKDAILLEGRILGIADYYDRLLVGLPYQGPVGHKRALELIQDESGVRFDPKIVDVFVEFQNDFKEAAAKFA